LPIVLPATCLPIVLPANSTPISEFESSIPDSTNRPIHTYRRRDSTCLMPISPSPASTDSRVGHA
jgi:hypothetical protein